jgi:Zn-finger nucleic acid-binding protein
VWVNIEEEVEFLPPDTEHGHVTCPNCGTACEPLSPKDLPECIIDRCPSCEGFWLDKDELEGLRDVVTSVHSNFLENSKEKQDRDLDKFRRRSFLTTVLWGLIDIA